MKIGFFLLVLSLTSVHATTFSQQKVSLDVKNGTLLHVLDLLQEQSGYTFLFSSEDVKNVTNLSIKVENEDLFNVLKQCLQGTCLSFEVNEKLVVLRRLVSKMDEPEKKSIRLKGFVYDTKKQPMPGVTVRLIGTSVGPATDANGRFSVVLPVEKGQLEFSFVGFRSQIVHFSEKMEVDTLRITMHEDVQAIDEVVVTGYGDVSRKNYTGAATTVRAADILMPGVSSIDQMLQGVVPGMLVWNTTGQVGATPKIRVRGTSTLLGSQEPVWVVDGVVQRDPQPFNSDENLKFSTDADDIKELAGNAISWLNPYDIETITVLKDASATAIYGSKAANGVIVVTTKKATAGKVAVNYSGDFTIGQRPRYGLYDLMNSEEHMRLQKEIYEERRKYPSASFMLPIGYYGLQQKLLQREITLEEMDLEYRKLARTNTNWFDILFRNSFSHTHSLGISGGSEKVQNRTSFGFTQQKGEAKGNDVTNFTVSSNTTVQLWERVTVNMLLNGSIREVDGFAYGVDPFTYAYNTSRAIPAYHEDGSLYYHDKQGQLSNVISGKTTYNYNILNELANTGSENTTRTWGTIFDLKWEILPGLEYQGLFSYASSSANSEQYAGERSFYITSIRGYEYGTVKTTDSGYRSTPLPVGGVLSTDMTNTRTVTVRNSLVYDRLFREKHRVTLQVGIETNSVKTKGETNLRYGYLPERGETFATPPISYKVIFTEYDNTDIVNGTHTIVNRIENELSEFATGVYTYDDRYVANFSVRADASNRFGQDKNKRFQPTWSAGVKWRVTREAFLRNSWWLNNLDIYGSYGYQGNAVTSVCPELIATDQYYNQYQAFGLKVKSLPYPSLGWEKTKTWNVGVDASLLEGRVNFTFNYFKKISDVLASREIAYENGMANGIVFGSTMKNYGYDFVINVVPVRTEKFTWQLSLNTSVTKNGVKDNERVNTLDDYLNGSAVVNGRPFSTFYSYKFAGLDKEYGTPTFENTDLENGGSPKDFLVESGKFTPDFSGGLNTMLKYKQFSLYALFAVQFGGHDRLPDFYASSLSTGSGLPGPEKNVSRKLMNRWRNPGDDTQIPALPGGEGTEYVRLPVTQTSTSSLQNCYVMYNNSDIRVANTDFIRCRSLSLSYDFTGKWLNKMGLSYLSMKASMTNPFMWVSDKKWDGLDPETGNWPARRVTSLSLQVRF